MEIELTFDYRFRVTDHYRLGPLHSATRHPHFEGISTKLFPKGIASADSSYFLIGLHQIGRQTFLACINLLVLLCCQLCSSIQCYCLYRYLDQYLYFGYFVSVFILRNRLAWKNLSSLWVTQILLEQWYYHQQTTQRIILSLFPTTCLQ